MYSEDYDGANAQERSGEDVYSKPVRAGKRTYFFDVKATKGNDYYLTITESKRRVDTNGHFAYDKHKIFLYKEDFEKFAEGLEEVIQYIKTNCLKGESAGAKFTSVNFSPAPSPLRQLVLMYLITSSRPSVNFSKSSL